MLEVNTAREKCSFTFDHLNNFLVCNFSCEKDVSDKHLCTVISNIKKHKSVLLHHKVERSEFLTEQCVLYKQKETRDNVEDENSSKQEINELYQLVSQLSNLIVLAQNLKISILNFLIEHWSTMKQIKIKIKYYKKQCSNFRKQDSGKFCSSRISDLENEIKALQNEKNEAQQKLQEVFHKFFYPTTETERWYEGIITKKSHNNFYVRYEGDDSLYSYPLMDDYKNGDLELKCVGIYTEDFLGMYILHMFLNENGRGLVESQSFRCR